MKSAIYSRYSIWLWELHGNGGGQVEILYVHPRVGCGRGAAESGGDLIGQEEPGIDPCESCKLASRQMRR